MSILSTAEQKVVSAIESVRSLYGSDVLANVAVVHKLCASFFQGTGDSQEFTGQYHGAKSNKTTSTIPEAVQAMKIHSYNLL
jgi:hypothetical protein